MNSLEEILLPIQKELSGVSDIIEKEVTGGDELLSKIARYSLSSKGKLLRPALVLLSSKALGAKNISKSIKAAGAVELIHTATLVHDDIIDKALYRRERKTINARWGSDNAILFGDFLYSASFRLLSGVGDLKLLTYIVDVARNICEGEINQLSSAFKYINEKKYLDIIKRKTAKLFEASCKLGAICGAGKQAAVNTLACYGYNFGMAFQIVDDCIDIIGDDSSFGKSTGRDIQEGKYTLPLIYCKKDLKENIFSGNSNYIRKTIMENGAIGKAIKKARIFISKANRGLEKIKDSVFKNSLLALSDFIVDRVDLYLK